MTGDVSVRMSFAIRSSGITRRELFTAGAALAVSSAAAGSSEHANGTIQADAGVESSTYLSAAGEAARWIRSAQTAKSTGIGWFPDPDHPEHLTTVGPDNTIYSGSAGTILFFLELARATADESYLEDAKRGADYLVASWRDLPGNAGQSALRDRGLSLDQGLAGVAFTLTQVWQATHVARYRSAAEAATAALVAAAAPTGVGVEWLPSPAVGLGGGIVLYLLHAARALNRRPWLEVAARGGDRILELSRDDGRGGLWWQGIPQGTASLAASLPANAYFPNFELGTAGVAYVLARLYEETGRTTYLEAARAGARHIQNIATVQGDAALVYYREPDLKNLYYLGYCHGPAGTARLFYQLHKVTGERDYLEWAEKLARGVINSGVPEKQTPGYWNVACQCCGAAAEVDFFLSLWLATGKVEYRNFARRVADQLISRQSDLDGKGYRWYQAWTRVKPWDVSAETGYKIGASGIGAALLHTYLALEGRYAAILLPDNPFPQTLRT
jgi:uncharacterized protein YyaL (SSP411 family)